MLWNSTKIVVLDKGCRKRDGVLFLSRRRIEPVAQSWRASFPDYRPKAVIVQVRLERDRH